MNLSCRVVEGRAVISSHGSALLKGAVAVLAQAESHSGASSFLTTRMGYNLADMHVSWGSERWERAERSVLWSLLTWIFFLI